MAQRSSDPRSADLIRAAIDVNDTAEKTVKTIQAGKRTAVRYSVLISTSKLLVAMVVVVVVVGNVVCWLGRNQSLNRACT